MNKSDLLERYILKAESLAWSKFGETFHELTDESQRDIYDQAVTEVDDDLRTEADLRR